MNAKAGLTPNDTDEYSISYTKQSGVKDAPFSVSDPITTQKDWTWPYWDVESVYFLSNTAIGDAAQLKVKAYYNTFTNGLFSYDNANYNTQSTPKAFRSYYDDYAYGGDVEGDVNLGKLDILKGAFFYRRDNHDEWETIYSPFLFTEPHQVTIEDTFSWALENRFHITPQLDWVTGGSYDWRHLIQAQDYVDPTATAAGVFINYPLANGHAWNGQTALIYSFDQSANIYANVSDRTRFPTIFDRFSTRFGGATSNPTLLPERAANYEIGGSNIFGATKVAASIYYSHVTNAIESVPIIFQGTAVTQSQNVGIGNYYGAELSVDTKLSEALNGGLRYTYSKRDIDNPGMPSFQLTGVPTHQAFVYLTWQALPSLTITPSVQAASDRWTVTTNGLLYYRTGAYGLINFEADWHITPHIDLAIGGRNLNDDNYQLTAGFPEPGRTFFMTLRVKS